jgi:membrane protein YqaA with SNARE-associated domain
LGYSLIGILLLQKANPWLLSSIVVGIGTTSVILMRIIQNEIIQELAIFKKLDKQDPFHRRVNQINTYFRSRKSIEKFSLRREKNLETRRGKVSTFLFAIFCYLPIIPDIIATRLLYKKMKFIPFVLAVIIGKIINYVPLIFLGK